MNKITWYNPNSHEDPDNDWTEEANAYDEDLATPATCMLFGIRYHGPLILSMAFPVKADRIRFSLTYRAKPPVNGTTVRIDVHKDGEWENVFSTENPQENEWIEQTFSKGIVDKIRIRAKKAKQVGGARHYVRINEVDLGLLLK